MNYQFQQQDQTAKCAADVNTRQWQGLTSSGVGSSVPPPYPALETVGSVIQNSISEIREVLGLVTTLANQVIGSEPEAANNKAELRIDSLMNLAQELRDLIRKTQYQASRIAENL